jgi:hypothetical protein
MENEVSPIAAAATDDTNKMKKKALPHQQEIVALISDCIKIRNGADNLMYMSVYAFQKMGKKLGAWGGGDKYYVDEASALPIMLLHNGEQSNLPGFNFSIQLMHNK